MSNKTIFLTGVTGVLGQDLIKELLRTTDSNLFLLSRSKNKSSHLDRIKKILEADGMESLIGTRIKVVAGDVTKPLFGMKKSDIDLLRKEVEVFYHIAALTELNGSEEDCFRINIKGSEHALDLAWDFKKNGKLERFVYFSTAFVSGSLQTYVALEDSLPENPAHANFYESSKYASEKNIRRAITEGLPVTIMRPSIVVGHSETGEVTDFNVIYPFMKLFAHGAISKLVTRPENTFNIVPINFIIKATCAIISNPETIGKTFHLVSKNPPSIGMLLDLKCREYPTIPEVEMIDPKNFSNSDFGPDEKFVFDMMKPYLGYLNHHLSFDTTNTEKALEGTGISFPNTDYAFLKTIIDYAIKVGYLLVD